MSKQNWTEWFLIWGEGVAEVYHEQSPPVRLVMALLIGGVVLMGICLPVLVVAGLITMAGPMGWNIIVILLFIATMYVIGAIVMDVLDGTV